MYSRHYFKPRLAILLLFVLAFNPVTRGSENKPGKEDHKQKKHTGVIPDDIRQLREQARFTYYEMGDLQKADSLCQLALKKADLTFRAELILDVLNDYMEMNEMGYDHKRANEYARRAENLVFQVDDPDLVWKTYINVSEVYLGEYDFENAISFSYKALTAAEQRNNKAMKAKSYLCIGKALQDNNQNIEGFRYYLNALTIAESTKNRELLQECYDHLAQFYNYTKGYRKAIEYKMKQIDLIQGSDPVDSTKLMWTWCSLEEFSVNSDNIVHEERLCEIIRFAIRHHNNYLKQYVLALFRSYLMNNDMFSRLRILYEETYPDELAYLKTNQPSIYNRLMAIFHELDQEYDSATYFYQQAEELTKNSSNIVMVSNFYIRYGEFLKRRGELAEATKKFLLAFDFAQQAKYYEFSMKASLALKDLYALQGDYEQALRFSETGNAITDTLAKINRKDEMLTLEIQNTAQIRDLALQEEVLATERRNNIQYTFIVLMLISVFIILIMLGSFKVSANMVHFLGFFSFIFLFEFIILIADNYIHHITHGEPLKVLAIKIVLIGILLPFHHWIEKRVTHFLVHRKLISLKRVPFKTALKNLKTIAREIWAKWD